ncbi:hypothetical protein B7494_g8502 [Chlorociboria aeruginascens]|nr:hypothetical protein B7494_g8502 [Chlorociboria aeruginascens]
MPCYANSSSLRSNRTLYTIVAQPRSPLPFEHPTPIPLSTNTDYLPTTPAPPPSTPHNTPISQRIHRPEATAPVGSLALTPARTMLLDNHHLIIPPATAFPLPPNLPPLLHDDPLGLHPNRHRSRFPHDPHGSRRPVPPHLDRLAHASTTPPTPRMALPPLPHHHALRIIRARHPRNVQTRVDQPQQ